MATLQSEATDKIPGISARMSRAINEAVFEKGGDEVESPMLINLSTAENWLLRPELVQICKSSISHNLNEQSFSYAAGSGGEPFLLKTLAHFFNRYFHPATIVKPDHIATTSGAGNCLDAAIYTLCDAGDSILIPAPCWNGFKPYSAIHARVDVVLAHPKSLSHALTLAIIPILIAAYEAVPDPSRIKVLLISNPHNPLGRCYPAEVLKALMVFCQERGLHFLVDEVYALSDFGRKGGDDCAAGADALAFMSTLALVGPSSSDAAVGSGNSIMDPSRLHVVWSMSKDFGSSGMRMGCVVSQANPAFLNGVVLASWWQTSVLTSIYVRSLLGSPSLPDLVLLNRQRLAAANERLEQVLNRCGIEFIEPSAGLYVFARIAPNASSWEEEAEAVTILRKAGVQVNPGKTFSAEPGWARITFALPDGALTEALTRLEEGLSRYKTRRLEARGVLLRIKG